MSWKELIAFNLKFYVSFWITILIGLGVPLAALAAGYYVADKLGWLP